MAARRALVEDEGDGKRNIIFLAVVLGAFLVAGTVMSFWTKFGTTGFATALGLIGIASFVAFWNEAGDIRTAIAAAVVLTYFAFITVTFDSDVRTVLSDGVGKQMLNDFNTFVQLVITTYIGGKSVEKAAKTLKGGNAGE